MRDELTTLMHEEFIGYEIPHLDLMVMSVYGAHRRGVPLEQALKEHGISKQQYDDNIDRVLSTP